MKWGKENYPSVDLNTEEQPLLFKAQLFALTGVQPERQKVMFKGKVVNDDTWDSFPVKEVSVPYDDWTINRQFVMNRDLNCC